MSYNDTCLCRIPDPVVVQMMVFQLENWETFILNSGLISGLCSLIKKRHRESVPFQSIILIEVHFVFSKLQSKFTSEHNLIYDPCCGHQILVVILQITKGILTKISFHMSKIGSKWQKLELQIIIKHLGNVLVKSNFLSVRGANFIAQGNYFQMVVVCKGSLTVT